MNDDDSDSYTVEDKEISEILNKHKGFNSLTCHDKVEIEKFVRWLKLISDLERDGINKTEACAIASLEVYKKEQ